MLTAYLKQNSGNITRNGGRGKTAVRVEHGNEAARHKIINIMLYIRKGIGSHSGGNDGMVVSHFGGVKHFLALAQFIWRVWSAE